MVGEKVEDSILALAQKKKKDAPFREDKEELS